MGHDAACAALQAGWLEASAGDLGVAAADLRRAGALIDELADVELAAELDRHRAFLHIQQGRPEEGRLAAERSLELAEQHGLSWQAAGAANLLAYARLALGDPAGASRAAHQSLALREASGDSWGRMHADAMLGRIAALEGRPDEAEVRLRRAATSSAQLGFAGQTGLHLANLGELQQQQGEHLLALDTFRDASAAATSAGDHRLMATVRLRSARSAHALGRDDEAVAALEANLAWYDVAGGGEDREASSALLDRLRHGA